MAPVNKADIAYLYDGSFDGVLTAVFDAYNRREEPSLITPAEGAQLTFGQQVRHIRTEEAKARRVEQGVLRSVGGEAYETAWTAYLSDDPDRATCIYRYLKLGFSIGRKVHNYLTHPDVLPIQNMCRAIGREAHHFKMFVRFSQTEGGVFYAKIEPNCSVLPLIMPHFAERYSVQPFLIHDPVHQLAGVFDLQKWYLVETQTLDVPSPSRDELEYRRLWKRFYDSVAVMERYNPKCRMNLMPKRFWRNLTEMNFVDRADPQPGGGGIARPN